MQMLFLLACALRLPQRQPLRRTALERMMSTHSPSSEGVMSALVACGRRGRWRTALDLISQLEATGCATSSAYRSALLACRKHQRHEEALDMLTKMGCAADCVAYNEVLHLLRLKSNYVGTLTLFEQMGHGSAPAPDAQSYYHLLHVCAETGRWSEALNTLQAMIDRLGASSAHAGHFLAALRACAKDRRWTEATDLARSRIPPDLLQEDPFLAKLALTACAEAGEADFAAELIHGLGERATAEEHAASLIACRRSRSVARAQQAWAVLEEASCMPDELCFALMTGILFDAAGAFDSSNDGRATALVAAAMDLAKRASRQLDAHASSVVITAALGCAITGGWHAAACTSLQLLHDGSHKRFVDPGSQLKVLEICSKAADWEALTAEAARARARAIVVPTGSEHLYELLERAELHASSSAAAMAELQRLREWLGSDIAIARAAVEGSTTAADGGVEASCEQRIAQKRFSRSIALPGEDDASLEVLYEDEDLIAIAKPVGVPVHPRHRFEANSIVNRVLAHLGGRTPYVLHRLDSPTSGVLLLGKSVVATRAVQRQFRERQTQKTYLAVCLGSPALDSFEVAAPIAQHPHDKMLSIAVPTPGSAGTLPVAGGVVHDGLLLNDKNSFSAKASLTHFDVIARGDAVAACSVRPITGRMHQIRVHGVCTF
jgi:23S rRNA-/tRNA-specific pseudouridylate synthase